MRWIQRGPKPAAPRPRGGDRPHTRGRGIRGLLTRFSLSLGDDLDELEQARQELMYGHPLVLVMVDGMTEHDRTRDLLREHGDHAMRYFGHWTITSLEGDAH